MAAVMTGLQLRYWVPICVPLCIIAVNRLSGSLSSVILIRLRNIE